VITFGRSASGRLREVVDDFIDMDENPSDFLIGWRNDRRKPPLKGGRPTNSLKTHLKKIVGTDTDDIL